MSINCMEVGSLWILRRRFIIMEFNFLLMFFLIGGFGFKNLWWFCLVMIWRMCLVFLLGGWRWGWFKLIEIKVMLCSVILFFLLSNKGVEFLCFNLLLVFVYLIFCFFCVNCCFFIIILREVFLVVIIVIIV